MPQKARRAKHRKADNSPVAKEFRKSEALRIISIIAIAGMATWVIVALFSPGIHYRLAAPPDGPMGSPGFERELESVCNASLRPANKIEALENGESFYPAEISALQQAQHSIDIEAYIFHRGEIARQPLQVLTERARAGVGNVSVVVVCGPTLISPKPLCTSSTCIRELVWTSGLASRLMGEHLKSVELCRFLRHTRTYPGFFPFLNLDRFYYDDRLRLERVTVVRSRKAVVASDHLPVVAEFSLSDAVTG